MIHDENWEKFDDASSIVIIDHYDLMYILQLSQCATSLEGLLANTGDHHHQHHHHHRHHHHHQNKTFTFNVTANDDMFTAVSQCLPIPTLPAWITR